MHKKVFISFVEQDLKIAKIIKNKLHEEGVSSWIYTEDNIIGDYRTGIMQAISTSEVMILIFSKHTENSQHIPKELREASENNIVIIPFFVDNIKKIKNQNIRYEIQTLNWIQGWKKPLDDQIKLLINKTKSVLGDMTPTPIPSKPPKKKYALLIVIFLVLILLSYIVATKLFQYQLPYIDNSETDNYHTELISTDLDIQNTPEGFALSWKKETRDIDLYELYRSQNKRDLGKQIYSGQDTHYINTGLINGITYYYTVKACKSNECYINFKNYKTYNQDIKTIEKATIKKFLIDYFATGETNSVDKILKFYSATVSPYLNKEKATREQILQDKINYINRWPQRKFLLNSFTILDTYQENGKKYFEVSCTYDWQVHSSKLGTKSGTGTSIIKIQKKGNRFYILGMRDIVSNDKKHVSNINFTFEDNGILLSVKYPESIKKGEDFIMDVNMVNKLKSASTGGGLTLSFPGIHSRTVKIIKSNFSSIKSFTPPAKMYNLISRKNKSITYLAIEGWHSKKWDKNEEKSFSIKLRSPLDINKMKVNIRGVLKADNEDLLNPRKSTNTDQQGYHVNQFEIKLLKQNIDEINDNYTRKKSLEDTVNEKLYSEGIGYFVKKHYPEAQEKFTLTNIKGYKPAASNYYLGEIAYYTKKYEDAIFYFKKSVRMNDKASYIDTLLLHTAISLEKNGNSDRAKAFYQNIIENYEGKKTAKVSKERLKKL